MGRVWTMGMIWGLLAWVPFFVNVPLVLEVTLGLPVIIAGYILLLFEQIIGSIPNGFGFCLSLPTGVFLSWVIYVAFSMVTGGSQKMERGVE